MPAADWHAWCRWAKDIEVSGDSLTVTIAGGRRQRISVTSAADAYELRSVVARASVLESIPEIEIRTWRRNRAAHGVGFGFDLKERLVAGAWVPRVGITATEFLASVRKLASEADLLEYQLTGLDRE